jgi:coenzyme F420 hydrogenase subunit beta
MIMLMGNNVQEISNNQLCVGCGTCVAICPENCIKIDLNSKGNLEAFVDEKQCTTCKLCLAVCPSNVIDLKKMNISVFGKAASDELIGNYRRFYIGHAKEGRIRNIGQSGGLITALLAFALKKGVIDGAVVTKLNENSLRTETYVAKTESELINAAGSKYCYAPVNTSIKEVLRKTGKYAVVELPCQMYGLRKLEELSPQLRDKVFLHFGVFCSHTMSLAVINFLAHRAQIQKDSIKTFTYRAKKIRGWPGDVLFTLKNGKTKHVPREHRAVSKLFFTHWRCKMCSDYLNEFSDICFGDAWLPRVLQEKKGETIVIARTKKGDDLICEAQKEGIIEVKEIPRNVFLQAQKPSILKKKKQLSTSLSVAKMFGKVVPIYETTNINPAKLAFLQQIVEYIASKLPYFRISNYLLKNMPFPLLKICNRITDFKK